MKTHISTEHYQSYHHRTQENLAAAVADFAGQALERMPYEYLNSTSELAEKVRIVTGVAYYSVRKRFLYLRGHSDGDTTDARTVYFREPMLREMAREAETLGVRLGFVLGESTVSDEPVILRRQAEEHMSRAIRTVADPYLEIVGHSECEGEHHFSNLDAVPRAERPRTIPDFKKVLVRLAESRTTESRQAYYSDLQIDPESGMRLPSTYYRLLGRMAYTAVALGGELSVVLRPSTPDQALHDRSHSE